MKNATLVLALGVVACRGTPGQEAEPPPVAVRCVSAKRESVQETVSLRGRVEPPPGGDLPIASQVAGKIVTIAVHEGQRVASGDVLAIVDDAAAREGLRRADAALEQARGELTNAETTLSRVRELVARGIAAQQELDDAIQREQTARANVASAGAVGDLARRTLGRVEVRSTFAGVITHLWRGPGALVDGTAGTPIVQLAASDAAEFVADATERELSRIRTGEPVHGAMTSGTSFEGTVRALATALDSSTGLASVRIAVASGSAPLMLGAFGRVEVEVARRDDVPVLPAAALRGAIADGAEVAVCQRGRAVIRRLAVGWSDGSRFEPVRGLAPGERVAVDHVLGLVDDAPITEVP